MSNRKNAGGNRRNDGTRTTSSHSHYSKAQRTVSSVTIYVGQKVIGYVTNGVFTKSIRGSVHMLRRPRAIAFDISTLKDAEAAGARRVEVTDTDSGRVYQLPMSTVWAKGFEFNRGFGEQIGVCLSDWLRPGEVEVRQPSLFEGSSP